MGICSSDFNIAGVFRVKLECWAKSSTRWVECQQHVFFADSFYLVELNRTESSISIRSQDLFLLRDISDGNFMEIQM